jgi:ribonuclease J
MDVHVSGHASSEELKLIHTLIRPKYFVPAHGEYRHLVEHSRLAQSLGQKKDHIFLLSNGDALEVNGSKTHIEKDFTSGEDVMVDGYGIGDVGSVVLKDRKKLSQSGLITISVALDQATGSLMAEPKLNTRGFVFVEEHMDLIKEAINVVYNSIGKSTSAGALDEASLSRAIKSDMKAFIYNTTKRSPMIIPVILYV